MTRNTKRKKLSKLEKVAYHEAGHAVVAFYLQLGLKRVSIRPGDGSLGICETGPVSKGYNPETNLTPGVCDRTEREIICLLAGCVAEGKAVGRRNYVRAERDTHTAINLASYIAGEGRGLSAFMKWMWIRTEEFFEWAPRWKLVEALAQELLERETVGRRALRKFLNESMDEISGTPPVKMQIVRRGRRK